MEQWSTNSQPGPRSTPRDAKWCPELANCGGRGNSQVINFDFLWCDGDVIKHTPSHRGSHCTFPWCKTRIDWTTRRGEVRSVECKKQNEHELGSRWKCRGNIRKHWHGSPGPAARISPRLATENNLSLFFTIQRLWRHDARPGGIQGGFLFLPGYSGSSSTNYNGPELARTCAGDNNNNDMTVCSPLCN